MRLSTLRSVFGAVRYNVLFSFLSEFAPIYPAYMILFRDRGYDYVQLSLLFVVWELSVLILEVPSGILADRWDTRKVLAAGMLLKALGFCAWMVSPSIVVAAVGFAFWGAQEAFCSGARQTLLYEALRARGLESSYDKAAGISGAAATVAIALSLVVGGPLFAGSPGLTLAVSAAAAVGGAGAAFALRGRRTSGPSPRGAVPATEGGGNAGPAGSAETGLAAAVQAFRGGLRANGLRPFLAAGCLSIAAYGTLDEFDGLWAMGRYGVPLAWVGAWGALRFGTEGIGALAAGILSKPGTADRRGRTAAAIGVAGAAFAASAFLPGRLGIPLYIGRYLLMSAVNVAFETRLQEAAEDGTRAGFLSLASLLMTLCALALAPLLGVAGDSAGLPGIFAAGGGLILAAAFVLGTGCPFSGAHPKRPPGPHQSLTGTPSSIRRSTN